jgi:hypothetical protein
MRAKTTSITVLTGAKEHPALYPSMQGLLTHGKGIIVLIAARIHATITIWTLVFAVN